MRYPVALSVLVYLLAGLSDLRGDFSMDRFFGLMPFFVIGLVLRPHHLDLLNRRRIKIASVFVLVGAAAVAILIAPHVHIEPFYFKSSYAHLHETWYVGMAVRAGLLVAALAMSAAVMALVPRRTTWFSDLGTRTLYAYLLHGIVVLTAKEMGWLSFPWLHGPLGVAAITSSALVLAIVLCLPQTRMLFQWMLEPRLRWLYRGRPATEVQR
jgi:fucose 4-O-acetylase-like acetyltransferase